LPLVIAAENSGTVLFRMDGVSSVKIAPRSKVWEVIMVHAGHAYAACRIMSPERPGNSPQTIGRVGKMSFLMV